MKTIIFDFDGTIADSLGLVIEIYRQLTKDTRKLTPEEYEALRKLPAQKVAQSIGVPLWRVPFLVRKGRKIMRSRLNEVQVFDELPATLKTLKDQGYVLRIVTSNSVDNVQKFLNDHELSEYFSDIRGDIGLFSKAKVLKKIIKNEVLDPSQTYYVGDEARDIVASKKAGLRIVSVSWGYNHEDLLRDLDPYAIVHSPKELIDILTAD
jgi:HAD superfamily hydrolase (TIGR01549 family)